MNNHPLIVGLLVALFGVTLGFSGSQLLIVGDVKANSAAISTLKEADVEIRTREATDISNITLLFSKNLDLNRELVELVKVQNELLKSRK